MNVLYIFYRSGYIPDFAGGKIVRLKKFRSENADFGNVENFIGLERFYFIPYLNGAVFYSYKTYYALKIIVLAVEDKSFQRSVFVPARSGN